MTEPKDRTPEEMLELARAAMPECNIHGFSCPRDWRIHLVNGDKFQILDYGVNGTPIDEFRPDEDPAHAWAVEQWLFDPTGKPYDYATKNSDSPSPYHVCYDGENDFAYDSNIDAALAVLERMKP